MKYQPSLDSKSLPALTETQCFPFQLGKMRLKCFPSSLPIHPRPAFILPCSWCVQLPILIPMAGKNLSQLPSNAEAEILRGNCRHLNAGCIFTAKTPKTLLMKEQILMVVWKIIPLEDLFACPIPCVFVPSRTMSALSRCRRQQVACEDHCVGSTGCGPMLVRVPVGTDCPQDSVGWPVSTQRTSSAF